MPNPSNEEPIKAVVFDDATEKAIAKVDATLDRLQEAHFWLHKLEQHYHDANEFRWHLNSFLKAIKEVPQLLRMELQNEEGFKIWFSSRSEELSKDALLSTLSKNRDFVVHRGMLVPTSSAFLGVTEGRGLKLGVKFPLHPLEDSDAGIQRYLGVIKEKTDVLGLLIEDEDSLPCVAREWRLSEFEKEVLDVCAEAWLKTAKVLEDTVRWLGGKVPALSLDCRHSSQEVRFKLYSRKDLREQLAALSSSGR